MWIKSALGSIGKAVRTAIDKSVESFKKVQREVKQKVSTAVNRIVTSKDAPKGTKSKVDVKENQVIVEIETPNDAIKSDIHESAKQAEKQVEWRMSEHAKELAEQNTLKTLHDAYVVELSYVECSVVRQHGGLECIGSHVNLVRCECCTFYDTKFCR